MNLRKIIHRIERYYDEKKLRLFQDIRLVSVVMS
jgi:uncharacterized protein (UPF0335 family)